MNPDYALIYDSTNLVIESRWFILDATKELDKSYTFTLHRDTVADSYDDVITAPAYIQKATLNPSDPFIFNQENITVNRIKKSETLLKDKSECAWIVGYCAPDIQDKTITVTPNRDVDYVYNTSAAFASDFTYYTSSQFTTTGGDANLPSVHSTTTSRNYKYCMRFGWKNTFSYDNKPYKVSELTWAPNDNSIESSTEGWANKSDMSDFGGFEPPYKKSTLLVSTFVRNIASNINQNRSGIETLSGASFVNLLEQYDNKTWKIGSKYYTSKIKFYSYTYAQGTYSTTSQTNAMTTQLAAQNWEEISTTTTASSEITTILRNEYIEFTQIASLDKTITLTFNGIPGLNKLPYRMFTIPVSQTNNITIKNATNTATICSMDSDLGYLIANALSAQYSGSESIYDIQLLPYCPIQEHILSANTIKLPSESNLYTLAYDDGTTNVSGVIYWCTENSFTFDINKSIQVSNVKLESIADMYRICSPNWNGQFEFNVAKNNGLTYFNVDCTYKPYTPYIHINPNFGLLYGEDFNDARGLICSGDFSLPQAIDTWKTYEINNKNYQNQFDRQIQNLELTQGIAMKKQKFAAGVGAISGAMSGLATGATLSGGNPFGAVAGMAVGGALSAYGAYKDIGYQKQLNKEVIDYTTDQFEMNNDNIQAMPDSLKQVGALTANNKIFPVLEYYSCTDEEKEAIIQKLFYNGMTVERIGMIADYLKDTETYIKCKLIRINIPEDNHYIESLAEELYKGVFIK